MFNIYTYVHDARAAKLVKCFNLFLQVLISPSSPSPSPCQMIKDSQGRKFHKNYFS